MASRPTDASSSLNLDWYLGGWDMVCRAAGGRSKSWSAMRPFEGEGGTGKWRLGRDGRADGGGGLCCGEETTMRLKGGLQDKADKLDVSRELRRGRDRRTSSYTDEGGSPGGGCR